MKAHRQMVLRMLMVIVLAVGVVGSARAEGDPPIKDATPFQQEIHVGIPAGAGEGFAFSTQIPAGKRLIMENVSAQVSMPSGQRALVFINATSGGATIQHAIPVTLQGTFSGYDEMMASQPMKLYADPSSYVGVSVFLNSLAGPTDVWVKVSGKLVPCGHDQSCAIEEE